MTSASHTLDALLGDDEPHASFHDAILRRVVVDDAQRQWTGTFELAVGDPGAGDSAARDRRRLGELIVRGLSVWALDTGSIPAGGLWLTADGLLSQAPTERGQALARDVKSSRTAWFLFFSDTNSFGYLAGDRASFRWL